jgi:hypothetical protein
LPVVTSAERVVSSISLVVRQVWAGTAIAEKEINSAASHLAMFLR